MKKIVIASFAALMMAFGAITFALPGNAAPSNPATQSPHISGQIMVKFRDNGAAAGVLRQHGLSDGPGIGSTGAHLIKVPAGKELQLIEALSRNPGVEYAEPDELVTAATADEYFPSQYALQNNGQSFTNTAGTLTVTGRAEDADADVDAVEAWTVTTGNGIGNGIKVAIIDSGVAADNDDISPQVDERANFSDKKIVVPDDYDRYGHGTHVAGIVAAIADNSIGVAGVCPDCSILDVKVLNDNGSGSSSAIANGIDWAVSHGAKVLNMSLGQRVSSRTLETAVNNAWNAGAVVVAAAGNAGTQAKIYPGAYPNVIAVAATDNTDAKASFSTYGKWVDVAAPGVNVYSTFPNHPFVLGTQNGRSQGYDIASGTSMASPIVAATAALVWSTPADTDTDNTSVRKKIESTADRIMPGTGTYWAHGRVNACKAVGCVEP
ncbi:thermitase [Arthrobacter sp. V4I6]|uniref:S8 family serine peptidase n=1 Tax=unclassified Arthrobacter TaxID=235627 RepID=UPI002788E002|nr:MULTISPECIES: S8 family serine peptidase [unclassified Arthrobacter]MDQ0822325.1 thermitase [Arthrobacter sp. V1I7]MDQ0851951.1 thermitase [Arthrobacter sp. V4I6]